jgi:hypothetical protein
MTKGNTAAIASAIYRPKSEPAPLKSGAPVFYNINIKARKRLSESLGAEPYIY